MQASMELISKGEFRRTEEIVVKFQLTLSEISIQQYTIYFHFEAEHYGHRGARTVGHGEWCVATKGTCVICDSSTKPNLTWLGGLIVREYEWEVSDHDPSPIYPPARYH